MFDSLLFATDGSGHERAIEQALDLASTYDATLHVIYVIDIVKSGPGIIGSNVGDMTRSKLRIEGLEAMSAITSVAETRDVATRTEIREGTPAREICAYADEQNIDLLILGSHGRSRLHRLLHGNVTAKVLRQIDCSVFVAQSD